VRSLVFYLGDWGEAEGKGGEYKLIVRRYSNSGSLGRWLCSKPVVRILKQAIFAAEMPRKMCSGFLESAGWKT